MNNWRSNAKPPGWDMQFFTQESMRRMAVEIADIQAQAALRGLPPLGLIKEKSRFDAQDFSLKTSVYARLKAAEFRRMKAWQACDHWLNQARASHHIPEKSWELLNEFESSLTEWSADRWLLAPANVHLRPLSQSARFWAMSYMEEVGAKVTYLVGCTLDEDDHKSAGFLESGRAWQTIEHPCSCGATSYTCLLPDEIEQLRLLTKSQSKWRRAF